MSPPTRQRRRSRPVAKAVVLVFPPELAEAQAANEARKAARAAKAKERAERRRLRKAAAFDPPKD